MPGPNPSTRNALAIYVDGHCLSSNAFGSMFKYLHEEYFPRVAVGPIPLPSKKSVLFSTSIDATGLKLEEGRVKPGDKFRDRALDQGATRPMGGTPPAALHR